MRIANLDNRAVLVVGDPGNERGIDIATASDGRFGPDLVSVYESWDEVRAWAADADVTDHAAIDRARLGAPSPAPRQVFAVGLNYDDHAAESGFEAPTHLPPVFTKYVSAFTGPCEVEASRTVQAGQKFTLTATITAPSSIKATMIVATFVPD